MATTDPLKNLKKLLSGTPLSGSVNGAISSPIGAIDGSGSRLKYVNENVPDFYRWYVPEMIRHPAIRLGLGVLRGVMCEARYDVSCDDPTQAQFIATQLDTYRATGLNNALRSMEYGWVPLEVMYRQGAEYIELYRFEYRHPKLVKPVVINHQIVGGVFPSPNKTEGGPPTVYLPKPKCFWCVHRHHAHPLWGESQLDGPHIPFLDHSSVDGFADSRRLYLRRLVIPQTLIFHPPGHTTGTDGATYSNKDIAAEAARMFRNGAVITIERDPSGAEAWGVEKLGPIGDPEALFAISKNLEDEMWMAMEIPPEVIRTDGTGSYNGREIPMLNLLNLCHGYLTENLAQFVDQVLDPLLQINFGAQVAPYAVTVRPLREFMTEGLGDKDPEGGAANGPPKPGEENGDKNNLPGNNQEKESEDAGTDPTDQEPTDDAGLPGEDQPPRPTPNKRAGSTSVVAR